MWKNKHLNTFKSFFQQTLFYQSIVVSKDLDFHGFFHAYLNIILFIDLKCVAHLKYISYRILSSYSLYFCKFSWIITLLAAFLKLINVVRCGSCWLYQWTEFNRMSLLLPFGLVVVSRVVNTSNLSTWQCIFLKAVILTASM